MLDCITIVQLLLSDSEPYNFSLTVALFRVPFSSFQLCDIQLCDQLPIHRILTINTPAAVDCPIFRSPLITPLNQRQLKLFGHARADQAKEYSHTLRAFLSQTGDSREDFLFRLGSKLSVSNMILNTLTLVYRL